MLAQEPADSKGGRAQHHGIGACEQREPVDGVGVRFQQRAAQQTRGLGDPRPDHLQIAHLMIGLRTLQPVTRGAHGPPQVGVQRGHGGHRVLGQVDQRQETRVIAQRRHQAHALVAAGRVLERLAHPLPAGFEKRRGAGASVRRRGGGLAQRPVQPGG